MHDSLKDVSVVRSTSSCLRLEDTVCFELVLNKYTSGKDPGAEKPLAATASLFLNEMQAEREHSCDAHTPVSVRLCSETFFRL